jgi:hypothetical protein
VVRQSRPFWRATPRPERCVRPSSPTCSRPCRGSTRSARVWPRRSRPRRRRGTAAAAGRRSGDGGGAGAPPSATPTSAAPSTALDYRMVSGRFWSWHASSCESRRAAATLAFGAPICRCLRARSLLPLGAEALSVAESRAQPVLLGSQRLVFPTGQSSSFWSCMVEPARRRCWWRASGRMSGSRRAHTSQGPPAAAGHGAARPSDRGARVGQADPSELTGQARLLRMCAARSGHLCWAPPARWSSWWHTARPRPYLSRQMCRGRRCWVLRSGPLPARSDGGEAARRPCARSHVFASALAGLLCSFTPSLAPQHDPDSRLSTDCDVPMCV